MFTRDPTSYWMNSVHTFNSPISPIYNHPSMLGRISGQEFDTHFLFHTCDLHGLLSHPHWSKKDVTILSGEYKL
jgi:hypothetical protein